MNIQEEWELHKPKKKTWGRFLRVIFGRTTFVITALLIQLVILCLSFQWLREHVFYLYGGFVGLSAVVGDTEFFSCIRPCGTSFWKHRPGLQGLWSGVLFCQLSVEYRD